MTRLYTFRCGQRTLSEFTLTSKYDRGTHPSRSDSDLCLSNAHYFSLFKVPRVPFPPPLHMSLPSSYDTQSHLKGEVMDLEFSPEADHRKRRRNRTTQSCLNCHTSKRKVCGLLSSSTIDVSPSKPPGISSATGSDLVKDVYN